MGERPTFLTREGMQKLETELEYLRTVRRQEVAHRLHEAMEGGDVQENAEYEDARNERAFVEGRILTLETILSSAVLIEVALVFAINPVDCSPGATVVVSASAVSPQLVRKLGIKKDAVVSPAALRKPRRVSPTR